MANPLIPLCVFIVQISLIISPKYLTEQTNQIQVYCFLFYMIWLQKMLGATLPP